MVTACSNNRVHYRSWKGQRTITPFSERVWVGTYASYSLRSQWLFDSCELHLYIIFWVCAFHLCFIFWMCVCFRFICISSFGCVRVSSFGCVCVSSFGCVCVFPLLQLRFCNSASAAALPAPLPTPLLALLNSEYQSVDIRVDFGAT